jgi:hypothetical protein
MPIDEAYEKRLRTSRILAVVMLVGVPVIYLIVASQRTPPEGGGPNDLLFYMLLVVSLLSPLLYPLAIEPSQIRAFKKGTGSVKTPADLFQALAIFRLAIVDGVFTYGLILFFISGDWLRMMYFYAIGAGWAVVYWPRRSSLERFIQKMEGV